MRPPCCYQRRRCSCSNKSASAAEPRPSGSGAEPEFADDDSPPLADALTSRCGPLVESVSMSIAVYPPPAEFAAKARVKSLDEYRDLYRRAEEDPEAFWGGFAADNIHWFE